MLQGVIFDIDGTLVDSNDAHAQSWVDAFTEAGYSVPFEVVRPVIGMGADKLLPKPSEEVIRRSATMELTFGALVLIATSVLVTLPSPR